MSVSPGGDEATVIRSGTAKIYAVLSYQDAADTEFRLFVFGPGGVKVFEHFDVYNGSGERSVEITGQDILTGYISAAQRESENLVLAVELAQESSSANTKRFRTYSVVNAVQTLKRVLVTLTSYPLPLKTLDDLEAAQDLVTQVETQALRITNNEVVDDELDAALAELDSLVTEILDVMGPTLEDIDTSKERAWPDGTYTTKLNQNDLYKDGLEWEVRPNGVPGTPAPASPTTTTEPTETLTPTRTPESTVTPTEEFTATPTATSADASTAAPTVTPTARRTTATTTLTPRAAPATAQPEPASTQPATPTSQPATPTPTPQPATPTTQTESVTLPPTATSAVNELTPTSGLERPTPVTLAAINQTHYPEPEITNVAGSDETPVVPVALQSEGLPETEIASQMPEASALDISPDTPLAPQQAKTLPVARIIALVSAVLLGLVAVWLRTSV